MDSEPASAPAPADAPAAEPASLPDAAPVAAAARRRFLIGAALVLLLALGLRAWGLRERGIYLFDEGHYLSGGRFYLGVARALPTALALAWTRFGPGPATAPADLDRLRRELAARVGPDEPPAYPKYTHCLLIAGVQAVVGDVDWAGGAADTVSGLATVALALVLGRMLYGCLGGLVAGLALALCPLHVQLSRGAMAEADSIGFLFAAAALLLVALRPGARRPLHLLFLAGCAVGACFTANYRQALAPLSLWAMYGAGLLAPERPLAGRRARGLLWLSAGMLLPLVAWEAAYRAAFALLGLAGTPAARGYFEEVFSYLFGLGARAFGAGDPASLGFFALRYVGGAALVLAGVGFWLDLRRRRWPGLLGTIPVLFTVLFFQARAQEQCLRYLGPALPFLALAAGGAFAVAPAESPRGRRARFAAAGVAALALLFVGFDRDEWRREASGFGPAMAHLRRLRESGECRTYICADAALALYYDPEGGRPAAIPHEFDELEKAYRAGARYFVVSPTLLVWHRELAALWPFLEEVGRAAPPEVFAHPAGELGYFAYEHNLFSGGRLADTEELARVLRERGGRIVIYDLRAYFR